MTDRQFDGPDNVALTVIGSHLPYNRVSNLSAPAEFAVNEEILRRKIGVLARAIKDPDQRTSDLCVAAFADLQKATSIAGDEIELLCVVTQNPDMRIPHTSAIVHEKLGLSKTCMTFDVSQGCAGYAHGLAVVSALADRFGVRHALLFTCDPYSPIVDPRDRNTALIFGDGATASYLKSGASGYRILDADFGTAPGTSSVLRCDTGRLEMNGRGVMTNAIREVPTSIFRLLERNGIAIVDVDLFLVHPGSRMVTDALRKALGVDEQRLPFEIADYGNTVSSSIPLMLKNRLRDNPPETLVMCGFGVGFSWGTCLVRMVNQE